MNGNIINNKLRVAGYCIFLPSAKRYDTDYLEKACYFRIIITTCYRDTKLTMRVILPPLPHKSSCRGA